MGTQQLSAKSVRRVARLSGEPIVRAWTAGHDVYVATANHRHGIYFKQADLVVWEATGHFSSCCENGVLLAELEPWD